MDERQHVDAQGRTKLPYASKDLAKRTIRRHRSNARSGEDQFFPYRCSVCRDWHLGRHGPNKPPATEDAPLRAIAHALAERNRKEAEAWAAENVPE